MTSQAAIPSRMTSGMLILIVLQLFCVVFFVSDVLNDYQELGAAVAANPHLYVETLATLTLVAAILLEGRVLVELLRRQARLEGRLDQASAAVHEVIEQYFQAWKLTQSERDVASFVVKGLTISEIADLRGSAEGTVKAHLNAIYRKAGARSRSELLSLIMDGLIGERLSAARSEA